ncbi:hypothetical protein D6779_11415 [Candidatus Parcubacteria bacterium]|nr:MAG: hypothetical protein D6779_11415 [Candidatus Parcubacteria bacterium]
MDIEAVLTSLDQANAADSLATFAPVVGPGAVISNNLEWSNRFSEGRTAFYEGDYELAASIFHDLNQDLPGHQKFLTPAKINETFCWLRLGKFTDYIQHYKDMAVRGRIYGVVLWNLAVAYYYVGRIQEAEHYLSKWLQSPAPQFLSKGYLLLSILQFRNGKQEKAVESFNSAWQTDRDFCTRFVAQHLGLEIARQILGLEVVGITPSAQLEPQIVAKEEVISALQEILVPRAPGKYPQVSQQLSDFEYQSGYIAALERFGDGDVEEALRLIESLVSGKKEKNALLWAKSAMLLAKREWEKGLALIEDDLEDPAIPGSVPWNAACAYFRLERYDQALGAITRCTDKEYRSSPTAWLARGLLAHLCGKSALRNDAIREAVKISPRQMVYYLGLLKQIGVDIEELPTEDLFLRSRVEDEQLAEKYENAVTKARILFRRRKPLEAAEQFAQLAPESIADVPEIGDTTFKPVFLPTCPAKLYDYKETFLSGVAAYQRKAYEEALRKFEDLYARTDRSYPAAVNFSAALIITERYSRAVDVLLDVVGQREHGGAYAIRNLISAFIRSGKPEDAFPWFERLLNVSSKEYFNFVQMAYVADLLGRKEDVATALFNACAVTLAEPSIRLKGAAVRACLTVRDNDRVVALVKYFVKEEPLPYVVAGVTRPLIPAKDCRGYSQMLRQYQKFEQRRDPRAALAYFQQVYTAREADYGASVNEGTVDALFNACMFYGRSLFWNQEFEAAHEILMQAFNLLTDYPNFYTPRELSKRYFALTNVYFQRRHYFWASELCEKGLEADRENKGLLRLQREIAQKIQEIPEASRKAITALSELPLSTAGTAKEVIGLLPQVNQLIQTLHQDFPESREVIKRLEDLANATISLDTVPIIERKKEIVKLREMIGSIERDLPLYLPRPFISALLPVLKSIKVALGEVQSKSVCPEFTLVLEPSSYYRENEASLVYKLRNVGAADIRDLRIRVDSKLHERWAPVIEEQTFDVVKKDESIWIDWPVHLDFLPEPETTIKPKVTLTFTGGSLRGEFVEQAIDDQETKLMPFIDISVDYPVVALRPDESSKLFGRENLLRILKNSFTPSGQTRIPFLEGVRKVGKTSILYFLASRLADPFLSVYVNLDTTWTNFYQLLAKRIGDEIVSRHGIDVDDVKQVTTRDEFERFLSRVTRGTGITHIVLLLDEFHAVIDRIEDGKIPGEILGDLRYMYMNPQQKVAVAFADWYLIDELKSRVAAQLWTDFAREPVSFLNELDTREAVLSPAQGSPVRFERDVVSRIYYWTNGYPWHIQWICSELINHLNTQKRYVVIPQDIDLIAQRLLREDRLFNEGVCRPERLSRSSQQVIYAILEKIQRSGGDICAWFAREIAESVGLPLDVKRELSRLIRLEILLEKEDRLRFCSPLHAMWFDGKREKGVDIYSGDLDEQSIRQQVTPITVPDDPSAEVRRRCNHLKELKSQLRRALDNRSQIFRNVEMPEEWSNASIVVQTKDTWEIFIGAMRDIFVEDMVCRLNNWEQRGLYPELNKQLHSIRLRRNYVEHPDSVDGKSEEEERCLRVIGKRFPTSGDEWLILQIDALEQLIKALEVTIEQIAKK